MPEALDCFNSLGEPRVLLRPAQEFAHLYLWIGCDWVDVVPQANIDRLTPMSPEL